MFNFLEVISPWATVVSFVSLLLTIFIFLKIAIKVAMKKYDQSLILTYIETKVFIASLIVLLSCIIFFSYTSHFIEDEIEKIFKENSFSIVIENQIYKDKEKFINDFSNRSFSKLSGSHPEETIDIQLITSEEHLALQFRRDSRDDSLYWVIEPRTSSQLGYVKTNILRKNQGVRDVDF